jgi:hypothetical protein
MQGCYRLLEVRGWAQLFIYLESVVKNDYSRFMPEYERRISWLKAALKDFLGFPRGAQIDIATALTEAARGRKADTAKPFKGVGSGVFEIASGIVAMHFARSMPYRSAKTSG